MKSDKAYLEHILKAINTIEGYVNGMKYEDFKNNQMAVDAVIRELAIVGEASNNLSQDFIDKNPNLPFRDAIDMRNFLIHEYFGVSIQQVWETVKDDLPELKKYLDELV